MNTQLLKSKKFRAAIMASVSSILTFAVSKGWLQLDVADTMTLIGCITAPFLIYIGAEGYSEAPAKAATVEGEVKKAITDKLTQGNDNA